MNRRNTQKPAQAANKAPVLPSETPHGAPKAGKRRIAVFLAIVLSVAAVAGVIYFLPPTPIPASAPLAIKPSAAKSETPPPTAHREFVGAKACMQCHQDEFKAWIGSHHALAMQEANAQTVLGNFDNAKFKHFGIESTFFKRDGKFMVRTDGPDGKLADYPVKYTFGVTPLQQYLIEFSGGRYQSLGIAWDSRPQTEGGQRWFHLYPHEKVEHSDQLHWTGRYQNWNLQCAECHSTNLKKGYDAATDSYKTTFSELNVACESCHGPASQHLDWAKLAQPPYAQDDTKGLAVRLQSRWQEAWKFPSPDAKFAQFVPHQSLPTAAAKKPSPEGQIRRERIWSREERPQGSGQDSPETLGWVRGNQDKEKSLFESPHPGLLPEGEGANSPALRNPEALMNTCWACHARRSTLVEGDLPGLPLEDTHRPALLTQPTYYADGQQRDEDYTWGSFRQSKMYQKGVTCLDCHEPHALKLRAEGNALCARCHNAVVFDSSKHHFHKLGSKGAQCIDCHAPEQNYMVIDGRHDHSFRLPRPDLSHLLGSPNACTQCHQNRKPEWAAAAMDKWYGKTWRARPHYGTVLHAGATQGVKALPALLELAQNPDIPAVVRATAATLAAPIMRPELLPAAQALLQDADPSVRIAALGLAEPFAPEERVPMVTPLLSDPVLGVRVEAVRVLADVPENQIPADKLSALHAAIQKYLDSLQQDADWPAANVNLGNVALRQGQLDKAISWYERALTLDPRFAGAYVNLADVYRQQGREDIGEELLRRGMTLLPEAADLHHALGLLLVRKGDMPSALQELAAAAKLAPDNARYAYVYGVGLHSAGKRREALAVLRAADNLHPYDLDILSALITMQREAGDTQAALVYARKAAEALPQDAGIKHLLEELQNGR